MSGSGPSLGLDGMSAFEG